MAIPPANYDFGGAYDPRTQPIIITAPRPQGAESSQETAMIVIPGHSNQYPDYNGERPGHSVVVLPRRQPDSRDPEPMLVVQPPESGGEMLVMMQQEGGWNGEQMPPPDAVRTKTKKRQLWPW